MSLPRLTLAFGWRAWQARPRFPAPTGSS